MVAVGRRQLLSSINAINCIEQKTSPPAPISPSRNVVAIPGRMHLVELLSNKCGRDPDGTSATISFGGFNVGGKLSVIRAVVHPIALKKGKQFLLGRHRSHTTLSLRAVRTTQAVD